MPSKLEKFIRFAGALALLSLGFGCAKVERFRGALDAHVTGTGTGTSTGTTTGMSPIGENACPDEPTLTSHSVTPTTFCASVNAASPGDLFLLAAGSYGPCNLQVSGTAGQPIEIRSADSAHPARFEYSGTSSNVLDVNGSHLTLRNLYFGTTQYGVDAIKIHGGQYILIQGNTFDHVGGGSVNAPGVNTASIRVRYNTFISLGATAIYLGVQDGTVTSKDAVIEGNLVKGIDSPAVGYFVEVKLNSNAIVRKNTIYSTKGPSITVYGAQNYDFAPVTVVEDNYVEGSSTDAGINISGGPAIARNNIVVGNHYGGIYAQDYGGRGLQHRVVIVNNTVVNNDTAGIVTQNWSDAGNVLAYNAILPLSSVPALSPASPTGEVHDNITCTSAASCFKSFVQGVASNLSPVASGQLFQVAAYGTVGWMPADDFFGTTRAAQSQAGAIQASSRTASLLVGGGSDQPPVAPCAY